MRTLRGRLPGKVRRVKGKMLWWFTVKWTKGSMLCLVTPKTKKRKITAMTSLASWAAPRSGNHHDERIRSHWDYWYSCQVPQKARVNIQAWLVQLWDTGLTAFLWPGVRQRKWATSTDPVIWKHLCGARGNSKYSLPYILDYSILQEGLAQYGETLWACGALNIYSRGSTNS